MAAFSAADQAALERVQRYRVIIQPMLTRLQVATHQLQRLIRKEHIIVHPRALHGGLSLYQLSPAAARTLGSPARGRIFGTQALRLHLSVAAACLLVSGFRQRLDAAEVEGHLGEAIPGAAQSAIIFDQANDKTGTTRGRLFLVFVPSENAAPTRFAGKLRGKLHRLQADGGPVLRRLLERRDFAFMVLCETEGAMKRFKPALSKLNPEIYIRGVVAPGPATIAAYLKKRNGMA